MTPRPSLWWNLTLLTSFLALLPAMAQTEEAAPDVTPATGLVNSDRAVETLLDRLQNSDSYKVRAQAAVLLGRLSDPRALQPLIKSLQYDEHFVVRAASATALGALADDSAAEPLLVSVGVEDEPIVRDSSARALTRIDARRNFDLLGRFAREGSIEQRRAAISRIGDLARVGEQPAIDLLVGALGDDPAVREAASTALSDLPTDRALPILVGALQHENVAVRAQAARLLGPRRDVRAVEALATAYERPGEQERVKSEIRRSLERLSPLVAINEVITQARSAPDKQLRARAIRLLGVVGDPRAASAMEEMLADPDPFIQGTAALALADLGSVQSIPRLEQAAGSVKDTRAQAPVDIALRKLKRLQAQSR